MTKIERTYARIVQSARMLNENYRQQYGKSIQIQDIATTLLCTEELVLESMEYFERPQLT
ncbi:hypothetical protein D3D03_01485 [Exiguobacterium sp. RIT452]|uniref:Uncharacterized protein n=1 Tax=Exiguobacterium undae TaxID=169177 RepID=A0ABX2VCL8_9BACL|nr:MULTISPECIES: hypothetical protein [Exiguobacterium]MCK2157884.1 hypothetical protein [Exiguobacterium sp. 17-1]OAN16001.1 hypothetical protein A3783_08725 [Exiguobacterium undae]QNR20560.1 hypothetical protein HNY42_06315 [Exiguobacterium sp. Helios]RJP02033.1 hypothetical protein D3D03_01485 [Exiguobacterium sp. RIT452]